jgi:hypothetical protein
MSRTYFLPFEMLSPGAKPEAPGSASWPGGVDDVFASCICCPGAQAEAPWSPAVGPPEFRICCPGELADAPKLALLPAKAEFAVATSARRTAAHVAILKMLIS